MITGFGLGSAVCVISAGGIAGVTDAFGEFLAADDGCYFLTDTGQYILTNSELKTLQTGTSLDFLTDTGDTMISYKIEGETTSAPDPE
jgi:hypothetical protein